jgi:carboxypeptidase Taq
LANVTVDQMYGAFNYVRPSYIRVEADEATYNLHIMLRFEIERAMLAREIPLKDVPGEWNRRFKEYVGIEVDKDANGCLQDVHWSMGGFGYFPTYCLGNLYAAQFWAKARKDVPDMDAQFGRGDFSGLLNWTRRHIHSEGARYQANKLCEKVTGEPLSHRYLIDYLYDKYEEIYGITR